MDDMGLRTENTDDATVSFDVLRGTLNDALRTLRTKTRADVVWMHRAAYIDGRPRYLGVETVGDPAGAALKALEGEPIDRTSVDLERPGRGLSGALVRATIDPVLGPAHHRQVYGPAGLTHELSMLVYEGTRFVARIVAVGGRRGFSSSAPRYWNGVREVLAQFVRQVDAQRAETVPTSTGTFVVDQSRRVEFASDGAWPWLSEPEFRERFGQLSLATDDGRRLVYEAQVKTTPMTAPGRVGLLVEVKPAPHVHLAPDGALTPTQRKVAEFACRGSTTQQIASATEMSVETVRTHMREVYRRLSVNSRVELAAKLCLSSAEAQ